MHYTTALIQLPLVRESSGQKIRTPRDVYEVCRDIAELAQEVMHVLVLDAKNGLLERQMVTLGLVDASLVHAREIFREAIRTSAAALILAHNHPSGDPTPSGEDLRITRQLIEAGRIIDIKVLDHIVIGRPLNGSPAFLSLRESGLVSFAT